MFERQTADMKESLELVKQLHIKNKAKAKKRESSLKEALGQSQSAYKEKKEALKQSQRICYEKDAALKQAIQEQRKEIENEFERQTADLKQSIEVETQQRITTIGNSFKLLAARFGEKKVAFDSESDSESDSEFDSESDSGSDFESYRESDSDSYR